MITIFSVQVKKFICYLLRDTCIQMYLIPKSHMMGGMSGELYEHIYMHTGIKGVYKSMDHDNIYMA